MKNVFVILFVAILSGCTVYTLVEPGPVEVDGTYTVSTTQKWSKASIAQTGTLLTQDGPILQRIILTDEISDGEALFKSDFYFIGQLSAPAPEYRKEMTAIELRDFLKDSVSALPYTSVEELSFKPDTFGPWPAVRGEYAMTLENGLQFRALIVGTQQDDKFHAIIYTAPRLHYFDKSLDEVERMIRSISPINS